MKSTTVTFDDFGDGIDRRGGIVTRSAKKFYELENYIVTSGRKLKRRPPMLKYDGAIDTTNTQGCENLNGRIVTVAKAGSTVSHTVADVDTVYFDAPEGSTTWELLELVTYNETVCALIRHAFPASTACPYRNFLHVFDGQRATYVTDPAFPQSWAPSFPTHPYGEGTAGAYRDYRPRMAVIGERLAMTTAGGDVAFCGVDLPRVWNTLSPAEILANGEMWYYVIDATAGVQTRVVPVAHADLVNDGRYAAYVCEKLNADGTWQQFREVTGTPAASEYAISATTNRFDATKPDETTITIGAGEADGTLIRFRALAEPSMKILSGAYLVADGTVLGGKVQFEGSTIDVGSLSITPSLSVGIRYAIFVRHPSSPVDVSPVVEGTTRTALLNGQQRYWSRMIAEVDADYGLGAARPGTISGTRLSATTWVCGGDTASWTSSIGVPSEAEAVYGLSVGDVVIVQGLAFRVTKIAYEVDPYRWRWYIEIESLQAVSGSTYDSAIGASSGSGPWYGTTPGASFTYAASGTGAIATGSTRVTGTSTAFLTEVKIGDRIEVAGQFRIVDSISDNTKLDVTEGFTLTASGQVILKDNRYRYADEIGDTGNEWYAEKEAEITLRGAGKDDALTLGTSKYDPSGAQPVAIAPMDNRLIVQYPSVIQSWAVGASPADFRRLATMGQGAGSNTRPQPALVDNYAALPTANGPRLFSPSSDGKDYVDFVSIGDMLRGVALPDLTRSVWWPNLRVWLVGAASGDGGRFFALSVHRDTKVVAWSTWTFTGVTTVDAMFVQGDRLVVKSGATLYYFDPTSTTFTDVNGAYTSRARWLYNDLGSPQRNKRLSTMEVVQTGKSSVKIHVNPRSLDPSSPLIHSESVQGPVYSGTTFGMQRFPVMAMGSVIGLEVESTDETGHELDQIAFDYTILNR